MKIEDLQTLCEVTRSGSFSKAAEKLHCTQSTASLRVKRVENWLGSRLLDRSRDTRKEVTLTDAGERVMPMIGAALSQLEAAWTALAAERRLENVQISVLASHTPGLFILPGVLAEFGRVYPRVIVNTHVNYTRDVLDIVCRDSSSTCLGIVSQPAGFEHPGLKVQAVMEDPLSIVTGAEVGPPEDAGEQVLAWLRRQILFMTNRSSSTLAYLRSSGRLEPTDIRVVGSIESVKAALQEGGGFAVLSRRAVGAELARGTLRELRIPGFSPKRVVYAVWPEDLELSEAARAFIGILSRF